MQQKRLSVAPMMDWTTPEFRYFARLLNPHVWLYTEMVTTGAILHGDTARFLGFHPSEHPIALQLGGSDLGELARCAALGQSHGYDEINLNVGCPSDRVQRGKIGACLMAEPQLVATCVAAMQREVDIPVTVKHRIGIDHLDRYEDMLAFVDTVTSGSPCTHFTVHARIAWLEGLSPKENRSVPPLRYEDVYRLKNERPELFIEINGGITTLEEIKTHLTHVDGVMLGRAAYHTPYLLAECSALWGEPSVDRFEALEQLYPFLEATQAQKGVSIAVLARHYLGLFAGLPNGRKWRQALSGKKKLTTDDMRTAAQGVRQALAQH